MLFYKGWLETRVKAWVGLAFLGSHLALQYSARNAPTPPGGRGALVGFVLYSNPSFLVVICTVLAGAGIATQPAFQAMKGLHGSTQFTLSLPVSRLRLVAVRAGVGWLEMTALIAMLCCGMWLVSERLRSAATGAEMIEYAGTLIAVASAVYFLSVLLASMLDDQARMFGTMGIFTLLWILSSFVPIPARVDIVRAIGEGSPLIAHTVPWAAMGVSFGLSAVMFFATLKVAQRREY